jgi:hypothetical protein
MQYAPLQVGTVLVHGKLVVLFDPLPSKYNVPIASTNRFQSFMKNLTCCSYLLARRRREHFRSAELPVDGRCD